MLQALIVARAPEFPAPRLRRSPAAVRPHPLHRLESEILALYIAGWSEADPGKIADSAAPDYVFRDGLVGQFCRRSLVEYFDILRERFAVTGSTSGTRLGFALSGPMAALDAGIAAPGSRRYWRQSAELGLAGTADIVISSRGIAAEVVAYDLNMASEVLRGRG